MPEPGEPDDGGTPPWAQPGFVGAAVGVAVIVMLALVLVLLGPSNRDGADPDPRPVPAADAPSSEPSTASGDSACGLEAGEQTMPVAAPPGTRWELVGTMAAPTATDEYGPGIVEDGFRSCFAHSPTGALYAAVNFWALGTAKPSAPVIARLAAATPLRARAIRAARASGSEPALDRSTTLQIAGFRFLSYDDETAAVELAVRVANGALAVLPTDLRWEDGDWKYVLSPNGDTRARQIPDLTGYAVWAGA